jgi:hypothetical protein
MAARWMESARRLPFGGRKHADQARFFPGRNLLVESVDSNERLLGLAHSKTQNCPINERDPT